MADDDDPQVRAARIYAKWQIIATAIGAAIAATVSAIVALVSDKF